MAAMVRAQLTVAACNGAVERPPGWTLADERTRNLEYLVAHEEQLQQRFPYHWYAVYDGDQVMGFEEFEDLVGALWELDPFVRRGALPDLAPKSDFSLWVPSSEIVPDDDAPS